MFFFASQDLLLQEKARKDADKAKHSALALGWSNGCGRVLCVVVASLGNLAWIKISLLWVPHGVIQSYFECVLIFWEIRIPRCVDVFWEYVGTHPEVWVCW